MTYLQCTECDKPQGKCKCQKPSFMQFLETKDHKIEDTSKKKKLTKIKGWIKHVYVESILIDDKPAFLCNDNDKIKIAYELSCDEITYMPPQENEYGYSPYKFSNFEINLLKNNPEKITKEILLEKIKNQIDKYIDVCERDKILVQGDLLLSYCLDWIDTLHYLFVVGETESGKSTILLVFKKLGYRCLYGVGIPYANIYNFYGTDEEGTGIICEDEAQDLGFDKSKLKLYKNSYGRGSLEPRIIGADSITKKQIFYKTFGLKVFAGERIPNDKGFQERLAVIHMTEGLPKSNIKRPSEEEEQELRILRNELLFWKVLNINKGLESSKSFLQKRDQELWEDFLAIGSKTKYEEFFSKIAEFYIKQRHQNIWNSPEAHLFRLVLEKISDNNISLEEFWQFAMDSLEGYLDKESYYVFEFGRKITRNYLSNLFTQKFQAKKIVERNERKVTKYLFEQSTINKLKIKYNIESVLDDYSSGASSVSSTTPPVPPIPLDRDKEEPKT